MSELQIYVFGAPKGREEDFGLLFSHAVYRWVSFGPSVDQTGSDIFLFKNVNNKF